MIKDIFTQEAVYAILRRDKEIKKTYIILSKLMGMYDMEMYTSVAENRIVASDKIADAIESGHIMMDAFTNDTWMDYEALCSFRDILQGYIQPHKYQAALSWLESLENERKVYNKALTLYQHMSLQKMIKGLINCRKHQAAYPDEVKRVYWWTGLEILSRTRIPMLYYFIKELPGKVHMKLKLGLLEKRLKNIFQNNTNDKTFG